MLCLSSDKAFPFLSFSVILIFHNLLPFFGPKDLAAMWSAYVHICDGTYLFHHFMISLTHGSERSDSRMITVMSLALSWCHVLTCTYILLLCVPPAHFSLHTG